MLSGQLIRSLSGLTVSTIPKCAGSMSGAAYWRLQQAAGVTNLKPPKKFDDVEFPVEKRRLRILEKAPQPSKAGQRMLKGQKHLIDMRGPELVHNKLIHEQFGIRALAPGVLRHGHNEMIRNGISRRMDESRMFAIWRVDAPWKAVTKKGLGKRMGGGKGSISHYVTPVKTGRIIVEVAGYCEFAEVYPFLRLVAMKMPFDAEVVSHRMLVEEQEALERTKNENLNPFSFEDCLKKNMLSSYRWASPYDFQWHGKHD